jgi:hypothetical protein
MLIFCRQFPLIHTNKMYIYRSAFTQLRLRIHIEVMKPLRFDGAVFLSVKSMH